MAKTTEKQRQAKRQKTIKDLSELSLLDVELEHLMKSAAFEFSGNMQILQNAFGALILGRIYGWRVLRLAIDPKPYANYQKLLNIKFNECCPDRGVLSDRSIALDVSDRLGEFWKLVRAEIPGRTSGISSDGELTPTD